MTTINQEAFESLRGVLEEFDAEAKIVALNAKFSALAVKVQQIPNTAGESIAALETLVKGGGLFDTIAERMVAEASGLEGALQSAASTIESDVASVVGDGFAALNDLLDEALPEAADQLASEFTDVLDGAREATVDSIKELGDNFINEIGNVAEELVTHASDRLVEAVGGVAEEVLETVGQDTAEGLVKMFLSAQMSLALQPVIAPLTPQLIVLKPAVPAIKSALEALP